MEIKTIEDFNKELNVLRRLIENYELTDMGKGRLKAYEELKNLIIRNSSLQFNAGFKEGDKVVCKGLLKGKIIEVNTTTTAKVKIKNSIFNLDTDKLELDPKSV